VDWLAEICRAGERVARELWQPANEDVNVRQFRKAFDGKSISSEIGARLSILDIWAAARRHRFLAGVDAEAPTATGSPSTGNC
jgi:hypothetical protein